MTPLLYATYLAITLIFIVLILRAFFYAFSLHIDPINSIKPKLDINSFVKIFSRGKKLTTAIEENS